MTVARLCLLIVAFALVAPNAAQAESRWSLKKLVPNFSRKEPNPKPKGPSAITKINNGTKAFFAKSKVLVPSWVMPKTQDRVRQSSESAQYSAGRMRKEARTAKRNFLMPWRQPEEPKEPTSVSEFLALPKPGY